MDKQVIKDILLNMEYKSIEKAEMNYHDFLTENNIDRSDVVDDDDQSHLVESEDLTSALDAQVIEHKRHLEIIKHIVFEPKTEIELGAIAKINNKYFVFAVAEPRFEFEGKEFIGVSPSAPIYKSLKDKKAGDDVVFNNLTFHIEEIY